MNMKSNQKTSIAILSVVLSGLGAVTAPTQAATWQGANANWDASSTSPGWDTAFPNAAGATAIHSGSTTSTTTQNVSGGVTVGTISLTNNSNNSWTHALTNGITLNQDGAGGGAATISNTNTSATSSNALIFAGGTLALADNLLISNTGASSRANGAIEFQSTSVIAGSGNITIDNALNDITASAGAIRFNGGTNTFTGTVNIRTGLTSFNSNSAFGGVAGNTITLGAATSGSASLLATSSVTVVNNWTTASGSSGTLILGGTSTGNVTYNGTGTLNSNLTLQSASTGTNSVTLGGIITGAGGIDKTGAGRALLNKANTYSGTTSVSAGTLLINNTTGSGTGTGAVTVGGSGMLGGTGRITAGSTNSVTINGTLAMGDGAVATDLQIDTSGAGASLSLANSSFVHSDLFTNTLLGADKLITTGVVTIGTGVTFTLANTGGVTFADGNQFDIFDWGTAPTGTFATLTLPTLTGGLSWNSSNIYTTGVITVVPEPSTWTAVLGALGILVSVQALRRRRVS